MPELSAVIAKRCPVAFDWEGDEYTLEYRPYSEALEIEARDGAENWTGDTMKRLLVAVLLDWNMTSAGAKAPIDIPTLTALPTELMMSMFYAVTDDLRNPSMPTIRSRRTSLAKAS